MINSRLQQGEKLYTEGNIKGAEDCFSDILKSKPTDSEALNNLGVIAFNDGNIEKAVDYLTRALRENPFYEQAILNLADVFRDQNMLHEMIPFLELVLDQIPNSEKIKQLMEEVGNSYPDPEPVFHALSSKVQCERKGPNIGSRVEVQPVAKKEDVLNGKKILHAPFEIAGNMHRITKYLRRNKVDATSVNYYDSWLKYKCDINLDINSLPESDRSNAIDGFAREAIDKYDIFHFHFAQSLYPDFRDLEELKQKGKKIIFQFWGSDQRSPEWIYYQQARFLGFHPPKPFFITMRQYHIHKIINRYADLMIGSACIPRGIWITSAIDTDEWTLKEKERILKKETIKKDPNKIYFVHAPSNNWKKGSLTIVRLLEECKKDGMPVELLYVNQLPQEKAKQIYAYADFAIDQVGVGTFGSFGCELMCWEIPILAYQTDLFDRIRNNPPIIKITKENFKSQIADCIQMKMTGKDVDIGKKSQKWVFENVDQSRVMPEYLKLYHSLIEGKSIKQYVNRSWYETEYKIQSGEKSDFYKYMIQEKIFEELGMKVPEYDRNLYI